MKPTGGKMKMVTINKNVGKARSVQRIDALAREDVCIFSVGDQPRAHARGLATCNASGR
jgi:hypothetical protein